MPVDSHDPPFIRHISEKRGSAFGFTGNFQFGKRETASSAVHVRLAGYAPLLAPRRSRTAAARSSSTATVVSHEMQASVMLTPFFSAAGPSGGTFWLPSWRLDSIITATMPRSPARIWAATSAATLGWLRWSLLELPVSGRKRYSQHNAWTRGSSERGGFSLTV